MKVKIIDENNIIVFLNNNKLNYKDQLEKQLKELFNKLKDIYKLNIYGYYNIRIYIDKYYGSIIDINKEDIEYVDYNQDEIDMRIEIQKTNFLYKINNYYNLNIDSIIYKYNNNYYLKLEKEINNYNLGKLLELSEIIYNNTDTIIKYGNILQNQTYVI